MGPSEFEIKQEGFIKGCFVAAADADYITARWSFFQEFYPGFGWLSLHCLEKYLKAILLLNGESAKEQSHDVALLYAEVLAIAVELIPEQFECIREWGASSHPARTPREFIDHLTGSASQVSRYMMIGHNVETMDLHMLDEMVFALRRICCRLEIEGARFGLPEPQQTNRQILKSDRSFFPPMGLLMDDLLDHPDSTEGLAHVLFLHNLKFGKYYRGKTELPKRYFKSGSPSIVERMILRPLRELAELTKQGSDSDLLAQSQEAVRFANWAENSVKLPPKLNTELKALVNQMERLKPREEEES